MNNICLAQKYECKILVSIEMPMAEARLLSSLTMSCIDGKPHAPSRTMYARLFGSLAPAKHTMFLFERKVLFNSTCMPRGVFKEQRDLSSWNNKDFKVTKMPELDASA